MTKGSSAGDDRNNIVAMAPRQNGCSAVGSRWLLAIFGLSLALRLGGIWALQAHDRGVETAHHEHQSIAKNLATGRGFRFNFFGLLDEPVLTSQQAPLVPSLLAASYLLFGVETPAAFLAMLQAQAVLSSATAVCFALLVSEIAGSALAARVAGLMAAAYPPLVVSSLHIQALLWNLWWLTLLLLAAAWFRNGLVSRGVVTFAIASVGGLLTDPILALVIGLLFTLLALETAYGALLPSQRRARSWALAGALAAIAVGIAPWTYRNYQVHGRLVFIKDSFFYVFWQGNNAVSVGTDKLLVADADAMTLDNVWRPADAHAAAAAARQRAVSVNDACLSPEFIQQLQALPTEIERMDRFRELAIAELSANPWRYVTLCGQRLWFWLWFDQTNPRSFLWHYRVSYLAVLALAIPGILLAIRSWREWLPVFLAALGLTAVHVLIITSARFRIPFELLLLAPASLTVSSVLAECSAVVGRRWSLQRAITT